MALETLPVVDENKELAPFEMELSKLEKEVRKQKKTPEKGKKNNTNKEILSDEQQQGKIEAFRKEVDDFVFEKTTKSNKAAIGGKENLIKNGIEVYIEGGSGDGQWTNLSFIKGGKLLMKYSAKTQQDQNEIPGWSTSIRVSIGKETMKYTHIDEKHATTHENYALMDKAQKYFKEITSTFK